DVLRVSRRKVKSKSETASSRNLQKLATCRHGRLLCLDLAGLRRGMNRSADPRISAAAADVGHRLVDVLVGRIGLLAQQRDRREDLPALAVAALRHLVLDPGLLHRM